MRARPPSNAAVANRLISHALGVRLDGAAQRVQFIDVLDPAGPAAAMPPRTLARMRSGATSAVL